MSLAYRKLCVKAKHNVIINDMIKSIVKGHVFWIRVKELEPWTPDFNEELGDSSSSDEECGDDEEEQKSRNKESEFALAKETEIDHVFESSCMHFPPGFTPKAVNENVMEDNTKSNHQPKDNLHSSNGCSSSDKIRANCVLKIKPGGSILEVMDELIEALWGNLSLDYAFNPSVGFSGVEDTWKNSVFIKSDNIINLKKKLQALKTSIKLWSKEDKQRSNVSKLSIQSCLSDLDKMIDQGRGNEGLKDDLKRDMSYEEIKKAVSDYGTNKSPGPDDLDAKVVKDFHLIRLIGNMYKIIAKILANHLSLVISDLIRNVQSAFVSNRQILDGPFILNELFSWCKYKKIKAMIFKVVFEKDFDLVRWDYLDDILNKFGFGVKWRSWIQGFLNFVMGSILTSGSPTSEFQFYKGLKQGDPLSSFLFILIMESLHLSFKNIMNACRYKGIHIDDSLNMSHLFYADDTVFIDDIWLADLPLKQLYLRLYALENDIHVSIAIKLRDSTLISFFRRTPRGGVEEKFCLLAASTDSIILPGINDRWVWSLEASGDFLVKSARSYIEDFLLPMVDVPTRWIKAVPIKINIFAWRVCLEKLPTRLNLSLYGELELQDCHSYADWLCWFNNLRLSKGLKDVLEGVFYVMWWAIWKFHNQVLFRSSNPRLEFLFDEIVLLSYTWCSNRCKSDFAWVLGPTAKQKDLYEQAGIPIVNEVLEGFNCTIVSFGQTGTRETYTMEGANTWLLQHVTRTLVSKVGGSHTYASIIGSFRNLRHKNHEFID
ncbi:RNA-directed DNA polymerase, eukaryota [Tanacetum coccineum]|uniref:RNA-directed DNA polymerase, eukaryota n=1 Tax=Tanacetum coccineum TaxID=301880 RepID=A0ABQ5H745_9ASTR